MHCVHARARTHTHTHTFTFWEHRGNFGVVKLAEHALTKTQVAVKIIDKTRLDDVSLEHLFSEVRCMKLLKHPNIISLYEVWVYRCVRARSHFGTSSGMRAYAHAHTHTIPQVAGTPTQLFLILEYADRGDLYDLIVMNGKLGSTAH